MATESRFVLATVLGLGIGFGLGVGIGVTQIWAKESNLNSRKLTRLLSQHNAFYIDDILLSNVRTFHDRWKTLNLSAGQTIHVVVNSSGGSAHLMDAMTLVLQEYISKPLIERAKLVAYVPTRACSAALAMLLLMDELHFATYSYVSPMDIQMLVPGDHYISPSYVRSDDGDNSPAAAADGKSKITQYTLADRLLVGKADQLKNFNAKILDRLASCRSWPTTVKSAVDSQFVTPSNWHYSPVHPREVARCLKESINQIVMLKVTMPPWVLDVVNLP
jgi:hypothetical protein